MNRAGYDERASTDLHKFLVVAVSVGVNIRPDPAWTSMKVKTDK